MMMSPPWWKDRRTGDRWGACPGPDALRGFQTVIHGVAHQVHQGVVDGFHHAAVDLGVLPFQTQVDLFPYFEGQIPDQAHHLAKGGADGTMRMDMEIFCNSEVMRAICPRSRPSFWSANSPIFWFWRT